jgi:hypothetical protein
MRWNYTVSDEKLVATNPLMAYKNNNTPPCVRELVRNKVRRSRQLDDRNSRGRIDLDTMNKDGIA